MAQNYSVHVPMFQNDTPMATANLATVDFTSAREGVK